MNSTNQEPLSDASLLLLSGMAVISLTNALLVALYSPLVRVEDALPLLLGATAVHILFHYYAMSQVRSERQLVSAHGASIVLAGTFAYHVSNEIMNIYSTPGYATTGGYSILKAGFFASVGLAAAGDFRREIDVKESLELLVQERTREIVKQAERLRMVGLALGASETAIAITDLEQQIVWSNAALEILTDLKATQLQTQSLFEALHLTHEDVKKFSGCFDEKATLQAEVIVNGKSICAEVSPFPFVEGKECKGQNVRFLVALKDITEQRARARAEKAAVRESMLAQAMSESVEMLSHELRTPLQGIIGMTSMLLDDATLSEEVQESMAVVMASSRLLLT